MSALIELDISRSWALAELPESLGVLSKLQKLHLVGCSGLTTLPESLGDLSRLQELDLSNCSGLQKLPNSLETLTGLQKLSLGNGSGLTIHSEFLMVLFKILGLNLESLESYKGLTTLSSSHGEEQSRLLVLDLSSFRCLTALPVSFKCAGWAAGAPAQRLQGANRAA